MSRVAVIGSRTFKDYEYMCETLDKLKICQIISGGAQGADQLAERYARQHHIDLKVWRPDWSIGRHAGLLRNTDIINDAEIVVAFWDGSSRGTKDSIEKAKNAGKKTIVRNFGLHIIPSHTNNNV